MTIHVNLVLKLQLCEYILTLSYNLYALVLRHRENWIWRIALSFSITMWGLHKEIQSIKPRLSLKQRLVATHVFRNWQDYAENGLCFRPVYSGIRFICLRSWRLCTLAQFPFCMSAKRNSLVSHTVILKSIRSLYTCTQLCYGLLRIISKLGLLVLTIMYLSYSVYLLYIKTKAFIYVISVKIASIFPQQ